MVDVFRCIGTQCKLVDAVKLLDPTAQLLHDAVAECVDNPHTYLGLVRDIGRLVLRYIPGIADTIFADPPAVPTWAAKFMARILSDGMPPRYTVCAYMNQLITCSGSYVLIHCGMFLEVWGGGDDMLPYVACRHDYHAPFMTDIILLGADHMLIVTTPYVRRPHLAAKTCKIYHVASTVPLHTWQFPGNMSDVIVSDYAFTEAAPVLYRDVHGRTLPGLMWIPNYFMLNVFTQRYVMLKSNNWEGDNQNCTPPYTGGNQYGWSMITLV